MNINSSETNTETVFNPLSPIDEPIVMESFCVNCEKNGKTTILLTHIPFFKEIIIVSFSCEECGYKNNEVQSGGKLSESGVKLTLKVTKIEDLSREVIKSEFATIKVPELELEVPSAKKGNLSTIEGFLTGFYEELSSLQEERKKFDPQIHAKIEDFLHKLKEYSSGNEFPFTFIIDDPSGKSHVKNPFAPKIDPMLRIEIYERTREQLQHMGFDVENSVLNQSEINKKAEQPTENAENKVLNHNNTNNKVQPPIENNLKSNGENKEVEKEKNDSLKTDKKEESSLNTEKNREQLVQEGAHRLDFTKPLVEDLKQESFEFTTDCHVCMGQSETRMCVIAIPYFKELIIMSSSCKNCGASSADTKTGGETSKKGRLITLKVESEDDLRRDCFKSETCNVEIPEIELELAYGTLGGRYTTIEGILEEIEKNLKKNNSFFGDSNESLFNARMSEFFQQLKDLRKLKFKYTIILRDPLANSFVQNPYYPDKDPRCVAEDYERPFEENEFLGLNDIKTENYN